MNRWVCPVCGYVHEGDTPPEKCPQCGVPGAKFKEQVAEAGKKVWACEHHIGDGKVDDAEVTQGLKDHFNGECTEVGMYLAMARQAERAKELGYDAIHDTVHEMAKDEARHGAGFEGLLNRYFK